VAAFGSATACSVASSAARCSIFARRLAGRLSSTSVRERAIQCPSVSLRLSKPPGYMMDCTPYAFKAMDMLKSEPGIRFTATEINELAELGENTNRNPVSKFTKRRG
jgi:hypothetical protein